MGAEEVWLGRWTRAGNKDYKMRPRPEVTQRVRKAWWGGGEESKKTVCAVTWPPGKATCSFKANLVSWKHFQLVLQTLCLSLLRGESRCPVM